MMASRKINMLAGDTRKLNSVQAGGYKKTEEVLGEAIELPTSAPGTNTIEWTLDSTNMPDLWPMFTGNMIALLYGCGRNLGGASRTVYGRGFVNGVAKGTGYDSASVANNYYWTHQCFNLGTVLPGDVIGLRFYANGTGVQVTWKGLLAQYSRVTFRFVGYPILTQKKFSERTPSAPFTLGGNPSCVATQWWENSAGDMQPAGADANAVPVVGALSPYGLWRCWYGDKTTASSIKTSSTYRPYYDCNLTPATVSGLLILT